MRALKTSKRRKPFIKAWLKALLTGGIVILVLALVVVRFFFVQSSSMEKGLFPGDYVFVNKMTIGSRLPFHPISIPYSKKYYAEDIRIPYMRIPGIKGIEHHDILAFNKPIGFDDTPVDKRPVTMKRCVALPGDTFQLKDKAVLINGATHPPPPTLKYNHHIKVNHNNSIRPLLDQFGARNAGRLSNKGDWLAPLSREDAKLLGDHPDIHFAKEWSDDESAFTREIFPHDPEFSYNLDNWEPVVIPGKGDTIKVNKGNLTLYKRIIETYENNSVTLTDSVTLINGKPDSLYEFKMDYYFVLGDDRHNSRDSRFWGFLPENHVLGEAGFVLFSYDKQEKDVLDRIEWHRFFKVL